MSAQERDALSTNGRATFLKRYDIEHNAMDLLDLLRREFIFDASR